MSEDTSPNEAEPDAVNMTNAISKIDQSLSDIRGNLWACIYLPPSQLNLVQRVLESLIGKFDALLLKVNQKIEGCGICDKKEPMQIDEGAVLDSGNCTNERRTKKLDPLARAHKSMSTTIGKLESLIDTLHPHTYNAHDLEDVGFTVKYCLDSLSSTLKILNKKIKKWEECQDEFNQLINDFGEVDKPTADLIRKRWEEHANGDESARSKASEPIVEAAKKYHENESLDAVLRKLYIVFYEPFP